MIRKTVIYSGHVQGVGFRFTAQRVVVGCEVTGYVRNLPDGRVELVAEGEVGEVQKFLDRVIGAMGRHIKDVKVHDSPATGEFDDFGILH